MAEIDDTSTPNPMELHGNVKRPGELNGDGEYFSPDNKLRGAEMEGSPAPSDRAEVAGTPGGVEMEGSKGGVEVEGSPLSELGPGRQDEVFELPADNYLSPRSSRAASHRSRESPFANSRWSRRKSKGEGS